METLPPMAFLWLGRLSGPASAALGGQLQQQVVALLPAIQCCFAGASTQESSQPAWARGTSGAATTAADAASSDVPEEVRDEVAEYEALKESLRVSSRERTTAPDGELSWVSAADQFAQHVEGPKKEHQISSPATWDMTGLQDRACSE